ncbi:formimidoylglutamate deiminase [Nostoc sp. 3335mG]|nr:formimidoylglutamate deiminase [Nostoc sp. 3335mG]
MTTVFAEAALLESGWEKGVRILVEHGMVQSIETGVAAQPGDDVHALIVPGMANLHSHAFQRAMAGLAEMRGPAEDSFWSWRTVMYRFALAILPDQIEAVAAQLYMEMLEAGFTRVGEFHYLHHDRDGRPYANLAEHAERIAAASSATGIALTLLPVFYAHSGFGGAEPLPEQRRFVNDVDRYARLIEQCRTMAKALPEARVGITPHSLRAATPGELRDILTLRQDGPVHIHIAEQTREVEDCVAAFGARPVEWLLANAAVDDGWTLVHATHVDKHEIAGVARQRAIAGLCPMTEANLGDGIFPAAAFLEAGGAFGVGSDSNVSVSLAQELRLLEYSQRLALRSRNVIAHPGRSTGERLFVDALNGGAQSLQGTGHIRSGQSADFVSLDTSAAPYHTPDAALNQWIFGDGIAVDSVWVGGREWVRGGRHVARDRIYGQFTRTMKALLDAFV